MSKQKNFIARLFGHKAAAANVCEDICWKGWWWRCQWDGGGCVPVTPIRRCRPDEEGFIADAETVAAADDKKPDDNKKKDV